MREKCINGVGDNTAYIRWYSDNRTRAVAQVLSKQKIVTKHVRRENKPVEIQIYNPEESMKEKHAVSPA